MNREQELEKRKNQAYQEGHWKMTGITEARLDELRRRMTFEERTINEIAIDNRIHDCDDCVSKKELRTALGLEEKA